ncbi:MAG: hybrid sensor histidine kinase/response regulator [Cyanobacteria bacterium SZAS LIN-3]|nr:hybrid sensor histidine kinase/response regulator [Cyanobacteria bacterium SZAS LIN-3]
MTAKTVEILLIEDSPADARYVRELLTKDRYILTHAASLEEAIEIIDRRKFDLVLLDLSLPDGNGLESFNCIYEKLPQVPIVVLTGLSDEGVSVQAVQAGAQDYILKQELTEYMLPRAIRYACDRKGFEENSRRLLLLEQHEEFMATLTHDLKNPLIGANRILELMAASALGKIPEDHVNLLLQLRDNNKLLLSMIQNLIEVYKFEKDVYAVRLEHTNILKIIESCIKEIAPIAANRDILVRTDFAPVVRDVLADHSAMRRVVQNLLDNALKFTPNGGQISLSVQGTNGCVAMAIEDTGPGIPLDEQQRLFERFSQGRIGKKYTPGTGLGLYLCKKLIDAHRGKIMCFSEEGNGTRFTVTIPAA